MSKPMKDMMIADYKRRFEALEGAVVVDLRGIAANENNTLRQDLQQKDIRITIVKNTLARQAFQGTGLEGLGTLLEGPSALVYGADSVVDVARDLVAWAKKIDLLDLKGAILDGEVFDGAAGIKRLSEFPTRDEAKARVVQLVLAPAGNLVGAASSPGSRLLGIVKEIQTRLEEGQSIQKTA